MARMNGLSRRGFTLIELLIVILIIGILAGLIMGGLSLVRERANKAACTAMIHALDQAVQVYRDEAGSYPGMEAPVDPEDPASNVISMLVRVLQTKKLVQLKEADLYVMDAEDKLITASKEYVEDPDVELFVMDPWGEIYIARENESKTQKKSWMHNKDRMDIYSKGKNMVDDTVAETEGPENDDIGNW